MGSPEKVCLRWNDFQADVASDFKKLRGSEDFTDVTLVCSDGQKFSAHKVILASSSLFFQDLLTTVNHSHPLIYMNSFKSEDMIALLDFVYHGETNMLKTSLNSFLTLAQQIQLKGLKQENENCPQDLRQIKRARPQKYKKRAKTCVKKEPLSGDMDSTFIEELEKSIATTKQSESVELQELDNQINLLMEYSQVKIAGQGRMRICKVCGKEGQRSNIMDHIEANHITGFTHNCGICGKTSRCFEMFNLNVRNCFNVSFLFRTRNANRVHKTMAHKEFLALKEIV